MTKYKVIDVDLTSNLPRVKEALFEFSPKDIGIEEKDAGAQLYLYRDAEETIGNMMKKVLKEPLEKAFIICEFRDDAYYQATGVIIIL